MKKQTKISYLLFGLTAFSFILHNAIFAVFKIEEPVFFILTFLFGLGWVILIIRNAIIG